MVISLLRDKTTSSFFCERRGGVKNCVRKPLRTMALRTQLPKMKHNIHYQPLRAHSLSALLKRQIVLATRQ